MYQIQSHRPGICCLCTGRVNHFHRPRMGDARRSENIAGGSVNTVSEKDGRATLTAYTHIYNPQRIL